MAREKGRAAGDRDRAMGAAGIEAEGNEYSGKPVAGIGYQQQAGEVISIDEAVAIIKDNLPRRRTELCGLKEALGRYLAVDVMASEPSPRYTNSAMDGFAVRWDDVKNGGDPGELVQLRIVGESRAGARHRGVVGPGEAIRISTGAVLAEGCDTVVRMEDTVDEQDKVVIRTVGKRGQDVRRRGEEFDQGELLLERGRRIDAAVVALLSSVGIAHVEVYEPSRVAIVVTGSELVSVGERVGEDQIRDANKLMLEAAVAEAGGRVVRSIRVADDAAATTEALAGTEADIILCSGGISVGRHDHVKSAAAACGFVPLFWRILQKPGKPLYFARRNDSLLFGLPGNPVSAFMCFTHYVRPLISALDGRSFGWPMISAEAVGDIENRGRRPNMVRVRLQWRPHSGYYISDAAKQGSHMLTSLTHGDGYILLQPGQKLEAGERIDVYRYDFLREPMRGDD